MTSQELYAKSTKSRVTRQEQRVKCKMPGVACEEGQFKNDKSRMLSQEWQVKSNNSRRGDVSGHLLCVELFLEDKVAGVWFPFSHELVLHYHKLCYCSNISGYLANNPGGNNLLWLEYQSYLSADTAVFRDCLSDCVFLIHLGLIHNSPFLLDWLEFRGSYRPHEIQAPVGGYPLSPIYNCSHLSYF